MWKEVWDFVIFQAENIRDAFSGARGAAEMIAFLALVLAWAILKFGNVNERAASIVGIIALWTFLVVFVVRVFLLVPYWRVQQAKKDYDPFAPLDKVAELVMQTKIRLTFDIELIAPMVTQDNHLTVFLRLTISNAGIPTALDKFELTIKADNKEFKSKRLAFGEFVSPARGGEFRVTPDQLLYGNNGSIVYPEGSITHGYLAFVDGDLDELTKFNFIDGDYTVGLSFVDAELHTHSMTRSRAESVLTESETRFGMKRPSDRRPEIIVPR